MSKEDLIPGSPEALREKGLKSDRQQPSLLHRLTSSRRRLKPLRCLVYLALFQFAVSSAYIIFFSQSFGFGRRLIVLHIAVIAGVFLITTVCPGLLLFSRRMRQWRFLRFFLVLIPACTLTCLLLLYVADYVSNKHWRNNVNYKIVSHYLFGRHAFQSDLLVTSKGIYLPLAAGVLLIFAVYFAISKSFVRSLEELLLPGRENSVFKNRGRALKTGAIVGVLILCYAAYLQTISRRLYLGGAVSREPVISFFMDRNEIYELNQYALTQRLLDEEPRSRASYPANQSFQKKNVIIIISDGLRPDRMHLYGYDRPTTPFLDSLLQTGRLRKVTYATSSCATSNCGILSTLTSKTIRGLIPQNFKVYDLLQDQGYSTFFILSADHEWYGLKQAYGNNLTYYFDGSQSSQYGPNDDRVISEGLQNVPDYKEKPAFFYFHLMSTHFKGVKLKEFNKYEPSEISYDAKGIFEGKYDLVNLGNSYDNGVIQADAMIQGIFESLRQKGYLSDSLIFILSDHGEGLGERKAASPFLRGFGHGDSLYQEYIRIPFLIYDDSDTRYPNLEYANQIDVAPTIVDRLGLVIPSSWHGRSLLNPDIKPFHFHQTFIREPTCYAVGYRMESKIYKYIRCTRDKTEEMYELVSDPGEKLNILNTADPSLIQQMKQKMEEYLSDTGGRTSLVD